MASHLASLWNRGLRQLGNGLFVLGELHLINLHSLIAAVIQPLLQDCLLVTQNTLRVTWEVSSCLLQVCPISVCWPWHARSCLERPVSPSICSITVVAGRPLEYIPIWPKTFKRNMLPTESEKNILSKDRTSKISWRFLSQKNGRY